MRWAPEVMSKAPACAGRRVDSDRLRGMMLGLAIGDALGNTSESLLPEDRARIHGEIRDYLPNAYAERRPVGLPSDDTQLAFWLLEHVLEHGRVDAGILAATYARRVIFGSGHTLRAFKRAWAPDRPWHAAAQPSAGNGALMRIAGVLPPHLSGSGGDLWPDAVLATAVTHNDPAAIGASLAFVDMLASLLVLDAPPAPDWWPGTYVATARPVEGDSHALQPRGGPLAGAWSGPLWRFVDEILPALAGRSVLDAGRYWLSGAYLLETVPSVLHILMTHGHDPEAAILSAVNDTKDNDTVAAIVGAAVGALHGADRLPARWKDGLLGRTQSDDDGRVTALIDQAIARHLAA